MRKYVSILLIVLLVSFTGLTSVKSETADSSDIDDFFTDYALVPPPEPINLPIVLYHQISNKPSKLGAYVITEEEFEQDLILFKEKGFTTVTVADLIDFVNDKSDLPEKPIMLTFDDGAQSDYIYALPLLEKHEMKAVFFIVGKYTDDYSKPDVVKNVDYAHLCWDEVREMYKSEFVEFQSHSYELHENTLVGALPTKNESDEEYTLRIKEDLGRLNSGFEENTGKAPIAFACPFGCFSDRVKEAVRNAGFSVIFTSHQKINTLSGDPEELFSLGRYLRTHNKNMQNLIHSWDEFYNK